MSATIQINRAPVLTLWAAVVAERLGYDRDEALTLGRAVAGMNAQSKAVHLGLRGPAKPGAKTAHRASASGEPDRVALLGRHVPIVHTPDGVRAASHGKPDAPEAVEKYLAGKFGDALEPARDAMTALAGAFTSEELAGRAFSLYERFRPEIRPGTRGWGAKGALDLQALARLAPPKRHRG